MRFVRLGFIVLAVAVPVGCGSHGTKTAAPSSTPPVATSTPSPAPTMKTLIGDRGAVMPYRAAAAALSFQPFIPSRTPTTIALLPPYRADDAAERRGIGFEYDHRGTLFALQEWPLAGDEPNAFKQTAALRGCGPTYAFPTRPGLIVTTNGGRVYALQIDGPANERAVRKEAARLVTRGLCRV
jgi:hypothetical protein